MVLFDSKKAVCQVNKYRGKDQRIRELRKRQQTMNKEELSKALVPYRINRVNNNKENNNVKRKITSGNTKKAKKRKIIGNIINYNDKIILVLYDSKKMVRQENKYKGKNQRINEFRKRQHKLNKEDLSKALVQYRFNRVNGTKENNNGKRKKTSDNIMKAKKRKITRNTINNKDLVLFDSKKTVCQVNKYRGKDQRIKEFRKRQQTMNKEDLTKALVPYRFNRINGNKENNSLKRKITSDNIKKGKKTKILRNIINNNGNRALILYDSKKAARQENKYRGKNQRIKEFRKRQYKINKEDLSKALVSYDFKRYITYKKPRKRKKNDNKEVGKDSVGCCKVLKLL